MVRWGGSRKKPDLETSSLKLKVKELEKEVSRLTLQLGRKESDAVQAMRGELSASSQKAEREVESAKKDSAEAKSNRLKAVRAVAAGVDAHAVTSQELLSTRLALEVAEVSAKKWEEVAKKWEEVAHASNRAAGVKSAIVNRRDLTVQVHTLQEYF